MNPRMRKAGCCVLIAGSVLGSPLVLTRASHAQAVPPKPMEAASSTQPATAETANGNTGPVQPLQPATSTPDITLDPASLVPDLPPLPTEKATLIGGTIEGLDRVQDEITIRAFGGGRTKTLFDPRTRVYRDGKLTSVADLKRGERVYADTILVNGKVFARNLRLGAAKGQGEGQGVVLSYRQDNGSLVLRDLLSPKPLNLRLDSATRIVRGDQTASAKDLVAGTLVSVKFQADMGHATAREVSILITPGAEFTFSGRVVTLDLHLGLLVVNSTIDHKTYEIYFDPSALTVSQELREGAEVTVLARYDGNHYVARGLTAERGK